MRRIFTTVTSRDEVTAQQGDNATDGAEPLLSRRVASALNLPSEVSSPLSVRQPSGAASSLPRQPSVAALAQSPLLGRARTGTRASVEQHGAAAGASRVSPTASLALFSGTAFLQESSQHASHRFTGNSAQLHRHVDGLSGEQPGDGDGVAQTAVSHLAVPDLYHGAGCSSSPAPPSPLRSSANSFPASLISGPGVNATAAAAAALAAPPSGSWRPWRQALAAFCLLNAFLAFLFAWMMDTGQTAFAVVAVHRRWQLADRAAATRLAGAYYVLLGLVLMFDRAAAVAAGLARLAGRSMRGAFTAVRHGLRRCATKVHLPEMCAALLRRAVRRGEEKEGEELTQLLRPGVVTAGVAARLHAVLGSGGSGPRGLAAGGARGSDGATESDGKWGGAPAPMRIRRRGN